MFSGASNYSVAVDNISLTIMGISVFLLLGVTVVMLVFVFKYHHTRHPKPQQIHGNVLLEVAWVVIPTLLVIGMFFVGYMEYIDLRTTKQIDNEVAVRASTWKWTFKYKNGYEKDSILYIPVNKNTKVNISSADFIHSFFLKDFKIKEDAVPRHNTYVILSPNKTGNFRVACAEYCGAGSPDKVDVKDVNGNVIGKKEISNIGHFNMYAMVKVIPQEDYNKWYASIKK